MENTFTVVGTMMQQLGYRTPESSARRWQMVVWGVNALKVSKGSKGVIIHYNEGTDLYDLEAGFDVRPLADGVDAENLLEAVTGALA